MASFVAIGKPALRVIIVPIPWAPLSHKGSQKWPVSIKFLISCSEYFRLLKEKQEIKEDLI